MIGDPGFLDDFDASPKTGTRVEKKMSQWNVCRDLLFCVHQHISCAR